MTRISFSDGKVVMRDGKVGTEAGCCCGAAPAQCQCGDTFTLAGPNNVDLTFTFGDASQTTYNIVFLPTPLGGTAENLVCVDGQYEVLVKPGNCNVRLFFSLDGDPECNCETAEGCTYILDGWENAAGCDQNDAVTNIEVV